MTEHVCHAVQLSPQYVDVAVLRWQTFTGKQAALESNGRSITKASEARLDAAA